jgi:XapX domain-containing protein
MPYLLSLGAGFVVGLLYWLVRVQSPAPPLVALAGLLGIVLGEHAVPVIRAQLFPAAHVAEVSPGEQVKSSTTLRTDPARGNE